MVTHFPAWKVEQRRPRDLGIPVYLMIRHPDVHAALIAASHNFATNRLRADEYLHLRGGLYETALRTDAAMGLVG